MKTYLYLTGFIFFHLVKSSKTDFPQSPESLNLNIWMEYDHQSRHTKSLIRAIVRWSKFTKATFSWLTNNVADVALSMDGEEKKIWGGRLGLLLCGCFSCHDSELNHKGSLTAIVIDRAESVATERALQKQWRQSETAQHRWKTRTTHGDRWHLNYFKKSC